MEDKILEAKESPTKVEDKTSEVQQENCGSEICWMAVWLGKEEDADLPNPSCAINSQNIVRWPCLHKQSLMVKEF